MDLNRNALIERRKERIDLIRNLADKYADASNASLKDVLLNEIKSEIADDKPYAMCARATVKSLIIDEF